MDKNELLARQAKLMAEIEAIEKAEKEEALRIANAKKEEELQTNLAEISKIAVNFAQYLVKAGVTVERFVEEIPKIERLFLTDKSKIIEDGLKIKFEKELKERRKSLRKIQFKYLSKGGNSKN